MGETNGRSQEGLLADDGVSSGEGGRDATEGAGTGAGEGWIERHLVRIAGAEKKTISIKWDSTHERMARDLETDLHFDRGLSTRTVNRSTLSALGLELLYERFYGKSPPGTETKIPEDQEDPD